LAYDHPLLPGHTVLPVAVNDHWPLEQREAWVREHGDVI